MVKKKTKGNLFFPLTFHFSDILDEKTCSLERAEVQSASVSMKPVSFTSLRAHSFILINQAQAILRYFFKILFLQNNAFILLIDIK